MGTGKSSVGRTVAEALHFDIVDTDSVIESDCGLTIEQIFAQQGEAVFRRMESDLVQKLSQRRRTVIITGGGLAANQENLDRLKSFALVVCLWASPETIWKRVQTQTHRPLLKAPDPLGKIRELLAERDRFYRQATVYINTGPRSPREVAKKILFEFGLLNK